VKPHPLTIDVVSVLNVGLETFFGTSWSHLGLESLEKFIATFIVQNVMKKEKEMLYVVNLH